MTYLVYVAAFGLAVTYFLWLRDARIFLRTRLPGYRQAAYRGVIWGALALLGFFITLSGVNWEVVGLGVILLALYLQGRDTRERIWTDEGPWDRLLGKVRRRKDKGTG